MKIKIFRSLFILFFLNLLVFSSGASFAADELLVGTIERPPFAFHDQDGKLTGFSVELWDEISKKAGISYRWDEHEVFSSLIDDAISGKNALAIANISITSAREQKADFSHPIFESGMAIAVKKGKGASFFRLIWESGILLFLGGAFLVLLVLAHLIWFFERNVEDSRHDYFRDDYFGGVWDAFWWAFIIMTMGGFENEMPHKYINRFLAMFWIVVSLFFISTLTAKITTALTVAELKTGIESYTDLAGKRVGVTQGSSHQKFLQDHGISPTAYPTLGDLYTNLKDEKLDAIVADYPILSYYASQSGADWMQLAGDPFNLENYAILFPDNSPYIEEADIALLQLREEGFYSKLYEKYFGKQ